MTNFSGLRIPTTSLFLGALLALGTAACDGDKAHNGTSGSGGSAAVAGSAGEGGGGTGGAGTGGAGTGGVSGMSGVGGAGTGGAPQTRCDRGGIGGDDCGGYGQARSSYAVEPTHLSTAVATPITVRGWSFFTIDDAILTALRNNTTITRKDDGKEIEVNATWQSDITDDAHEVTLTLTPTAPLSDGWYLVTVNAPIEDDSQTSVAIPQVDEHRFESEFRVGSAPFVVSAYRNATGAWITFSETVAWTDPLPITLSINDQPLYCTRVVGDGVNPNRALTLALVCAIDAAEALDIAVAEGLASDADVPVRNVEGDTEFVITLDAPTPPNDSVTWQATEAPAF